MPISLPFSRRTTVAIAVFDCIAIASPSTGAPLLAATAAIQAALASEYAQLINIYPVLIRQDVANQQAVLDAAINTALTAITALNTTLQSMVATGDRAVLLSYWQVVVANAMRSVQTVISTLGE